MTVRWLHISDIHECKREEHFRKRMFEEIVKEVGRQAPPDLVFLTGDMAFAGTENEYQSLEEGFITPLKEVLPADCPIFTIPGNHDVDRERGIKPRLWIGDAEEAKLFQSIDAKGATKRKDAFLPRLSAYAAFDARVSSWGSKWLESDAGSVWWSKEIKGAKVSVVGVNTAWLCQDDDDWGNLTPGRFLLERALDKALKEKPDLLIVLGHHPLVALRVDGEPSDGPRVIERLKQANAIYLHGHLHASGGNRIGDALRTTLTIQAPSAFQAHDNKRWRNGLMWGEVDLLAGAVFLEPRLWNEDKREYKFEIDAGYDDERVPGRDAFRLPLPGHAIADAHPVGAPVVASKPLDVPAGWEIVDRDALAKIRANPPSLGVMVKFFDGILPTWRLALAPGVQPRAVAEQLANRLRAVYTGAAKPEVMLLAGAGGEGKSTAVLHAAAALVEDGHQAWTCLHRQATYADLPEDTFSKLPTKPSHAWVIVIDDASKIGPAILTAVKKIAARTDVHLLLAARDTEWKRKQLVPGMWQEFSSFHTEYLSGLNEEDARRIVAGWVHWGPGAMGKLQSQSEGEAIKALLWHARDFAARKEDGELLGALLVTRQGQDMRDHVRSLVNGLDLAPVINNTYSLRHIYAMVASMHAENQLYLTRSVLAYALGCNGDVLERDALVPLEREAMLDPGDNYILTRHRRIAEVACEVMREDKFSPDHWFGFLARAAMRAVKTRTLYIPDLNDWNYNLPRHFLERGKRWWPVARDVAKSIHDETPNDPQNLTSYSSVLRHTEQAPQAMAILRASGERFRDRRNVLYEWSIAAAAIGDHGLSIWLGGRSLADGLADLDKSVKHSLAGLGFAFRELYSQLRVPDFAKAAAACGHLGVRLPLFDTRNEKNLESHVAEGERNGISELSIEDAASVIRKAVARGADEAQSENGLVFFETLLGDPGGYHFRELLRMVGGSKAAPGSMQSKKKSGLQ